VVPRRPRGRYSSDFVGELTAKSIGEQPARGEAHSQHVRANLCHMGSSYPPVEGDALRDENFVAQLFQECPHETHIIRVLVPAATDLVVPALVP